MMRGDDTGAHGFASMEKLTQLIDEIDSEVDASPNRLPAMLRDAQRGIALAKRLLERSQTMLTAAERRQQAELDRMIRHVADKATLVEMTDQAFRTELPQRVADQLTHILDVQGIPRFFSPLDRTLLKGFQTFGAYLPGVSVPLVKDKMRHETANVILPAEEPMFSDHLRKRWQEGLRMNVNFLGEAVQGESEAQRRLKKYLAALQLKHTECISVKISTIYSQISVLARQHSESILADRMELLYRAAMRERFTRRDGTVTSKFVYLDMEAYHDLRLTVDVLKRTLDRPELLQARAGIALQAYIPDSYAAMQELSWWASERCAKGGAPLTIRIVKGANMEMERVEASIAGWPQAAYQSKLETDANYKRMIRWMLQFEYNDALRLGVASHNLLDISLAAIWAADAGALDRVQFEMLEGMANHQRRALFELTGNLLLYAPACQQRDFLNAIGYLIRRLDENTGRENFLCHSFRLSVDSDDWRMLTGGFKDSLAAIESNPTQSRRYQNRFDTPAQSPPCPSWDQFVNEPNTDWASSHNSDWGGELLAAWNDKVDDRAAMIDLVVGDQPVTEPRDIGQSTDPSRPDRISCRYALASAEDIDRAIAIAKQDPDAWRSRSHADRHAILRNVAQLLRQRRGDLMASAVLDAGKTLAESDPEVSEAIDFVEFYALCAQEAYQMPGVRVAGQGVVAVISPWNFPIAIPCGGVAAALAAGNTVLLKPASDTVLPAHHLCQAFWDAGVPRNALQLLPCRGSDVGTRLIEHRDVDTVILTGGTETAESMLEKRPDLHLSAETGGKNATIVTALSDRDLAIKHVLQSAFGHSGQKCSATSLLLLEREVFDDVHFREALADAAQSLIVGSAWQLQTRIGPMIRAPGGDLARGLKELEPGESWLVMPESIDGNPQLYRPGIKWNVKPGSFTHMTELFGPVLGVMSFHKLEQAVRIVNATGFGLTSGLESLDDREVQLWSKQIHAGNLYINRSTTGAIVLRQPFGGLGKSAYGPGIKAGGPNYVASLMHIQDDPDCNPATNDPSETLGCERLRSMCARLDQPATEPYLDRLRAALASYDQWAVREYCSEHDSFRLVGQDNIRRYRPIQRMHLRLSGDELPFDVLRVIAAASAVGCRIVINHDGLDSSELIRLIDYVTSDWAAHIEILSQNDDQLIAAIRSGDVNRIRAMGGTKISPNVRTQANRMNVYICAKPVVSQGRYELMNYVREQSLSIDFHRYGNLGRRAEEQRAAVL